MTAALKRFLFEENVYSIGIRPRNDSLLIDGNTQDPFWILPISKDEWYADPMVFTYDGIDYLFCEVCNRDTGKGMIGYSVLGDTPAISRPQVVLEADCHLSYPCVFEKNGEIFMIPETTAHKNIVLFRSSEFPRKWEFVRELTNGDEYADTTVCRHNGQIQLFTYQQCQGDGSIVRIRAFDSEALPEGELDEYPQGDADFSNQLRGGGGNFLKKKDSFFRPSQDCAPYYGFALNFMQVEQWPSQTRTYRERLCRKILPSDINTSIDGKKKIIGIHTYGLTKDYEIIDVKFNDVLFAHQVRRLRQYINRMIRRVVG